MSKITFYSLAFTAAIIPAMVFAQTAPSVLEPSPSATPSVTVPTSGAAPSVTEPTPSATPTITDPTSSASTPTVTTPVTSAGGGSTPTVTTPVTSAGGGSTPTATNPVTSAGGGSTPTVTTPVTSAGGAPSTPTTPTTPTTPVNNNTGGSFSGGGFSPVPLELTATTATTGTVAGTAINSCPLLTSYLRFGANNNSAEVAKLQAFLKESQGFNVSVNGVFNQQTENAVKAFQSKYLSQVMGPWGATQSSGYVYITTEKKINQLACNSPLTLTPGELAVINAYKSQQDQSTIAGPSSASINVSSSDASTTGSTTTPLSPDIGQNGAGAAANTAAAANASILVKFWDFIKSLF